MSDVYNILTIEPISWGLMGQWKMQKVFRVRGPGINPTQSLTFFFLQNLGFLYKFFLAMVTYCT